MLFARRDVRVCSRARGGREGMGVRRRGLAEWSLLGFGMGITRDRSIKGFKSATPSYMCIKGPVLK